MPSINRSAYAKGRLKKPECRLELYLSRDEKFYSVFNQWRHLHL
ncbi:hypothetical protein HMPREF9123_0588 [Neisseria bacilliformis ATCC BAA-1200]|uniref:Uncharacterized protein n=1 Tax=Neisseria bacilliformis ATCC BAA-1200 TaxID=888742 RepID=F2BA11_9NEIS|nr:hypothetical protein HMPREF9123_0588 [Neisseria bacilliformis ATCC BAA-1200]